MALSQSDIAWCAAWCKGRTWQIQKRAAWKYEYANQVMVRYTDYSKTNEADWERLREYLTSDACKETLCQGGTREAVDPSWTPTSAWLELVTRSGVQGVLRLYHGLTIGPRNNADGPYTTENGCRYKVELTYFWEASAPPVVPQGTSGISYRIEGLSRDKETGLFTYVLEKRIRVQQDVAKHVVSNTALATVWEERHLGVTEANLAQYKALAGTRADGTVVTVSLSKNEDCTSDVALRYVKNKPVQAGASCADTVFEHQDGKTLNAQEEPQGHVPDAAGGMTHRRTVQLGEDGKCTIRTDTSREKTVMGAVESVQTTLSGTVRTVENRNCPEKAPTDDLPVGKRVQNAETPGGLWNQTITERVPGPPVRTGESCGKTIFRHDHAKTDVRTDAPAAEHVGEAGGGIYRQTNATRLENGNWQTRESTVRELPVASAAIEKRRTLRGMQIVRTDRAQAAPAPAPARIGQATAARKTDGGLYDNTYTENIPIPAGEIAASCMETAQLHTHTRTVNQADGASTHVPPPAGGVYTQTQDRLNEDGTHDVSTTVRTETQGEKSRVASADFFGKNTIVTVRGGDGTADSAFETGRITTQRVSLTDGRLYDRVTQVETVGEPVLEVHTWADDFNIYRTVNFWNYREIPDAGRFFFADRRNHLSHPQISKNRFGVYSGNYFIYMRLQTEREPAPVGNGTFTKSLVMNRKFSKVTNQTHQYYCYEIIQVRYFSWYLCESAEAARLLFQQMKSSARDDGSGRNEFSTFISGKFFQVCTQVNTTNTVRVVNFTPENGNG